MNDCLPTLLLSAITTTSSTSSGRPFRYGNGQGIHSSSTLAFASRSAPCLHNPTSPVPVSNPALVFFWVEPETPVFLYFMPLLSIPLFPHEASRLPGRIMAQARNVMNFNPDRDIPSLTGKVILITGGTFLSHCYKPSPYLSPHNTTDKGPAV
jgi:hypothetical protein